MDSCSIKLDIQNDIKGKAENSGLFQSSPDTFVLTPNQESVDAAADWVANTNQEFKSEPIQKQDTNYTIEPSDELVESYLKKEQLRENITNLLPNVKGFYGLVFGANPFEALYEIAVQANSSAPERKGAVASVGEEMVKLAQATHPNAKVGDKLYQLSNNQLLGEAIQELDTYLLNFMKGFGVRSKEFSDLKERLGVDALGATDVMNKLIWYSNNRNEETVPEEVGHMAVMLMGEAHPDIQALLSGITGWSEYEAIKAEYMPIYNNEKQVKIEAVGKIIAKALVKNYKANGIDQSLLTKVLLALKKIFAAFKLNDGDFGISLYNAMHQNDRVADHIAINVLMGDKNYIAKIRNTNPQLNYKEALANNPFASKILDIMAKAKAKLTGSLAIAGQGEVVRRPSSAPIHDIDFVISKEDYAKLETTLNELNAIPYHFGWDNKTKKYTTYAFLVPGPGLKANIIERNFQKGNGWIEKFVLVDEQGNTVEKNPQNHLTLDFFVSKAADLVMSDGQFKPVVDIYDGKLSLSALGANERLFQRPKDQEDYVLHNPQTIGQSLPQFTYFQLANGKKSKLLADLEKQFPENAEKIYAQVRSPEFKAWFGDWENDPENASKVVDENGEPLIVYHGSGKEFDIFEGNDLSLSYFTSDEEYARFYAKRGKEGVNFLREVYTRDLRDLTRLGDELEAPWIYDAIEYQLKQGKTPKEVADLVLRNIKSLNNLVPEYNPEAGYINDSGDEYANDPYEEFIPDSPEYTKQQADIFNKKVDTVLGILHNADETLNIIHDLENDVNTKATEIIKNARAYKDAIGKEVVFPVFLNIKNPQKLTDISNENIRDGLIELEAGYDGIMGTDSPFGRKDKNVNRAFDNENSQVFGIYEANQVKSVNNIGSFSTNTRNIYLNKDIISSTVIELVKSKLLQPLKTSNLFFFENPGVLSTLDNAGIKYKRAGDSIQILDVDGSRMSQSELLGTESALISSYNSDSDFLQQLVEKYSPAAEVLQNYFYEQGITMSVKTGVAVYKQNGKILNEYSGVDPVTVYQHMKNVGSFLYELNQNALSEQALIKKGQLSMFKDEEFDNKHKEVRDEIALGDIVSENNVALYKNRVKHLNNTNGTSFMLELKETKQGLVPSIIDVEMSDNVAVRAVVNQFAQIFPELTINVINEEELPFYLPEVSPEERAKTTSFVIGKDVYLIRGRVNANIALEEMLHPFISGMYEQNNALFENLFKEAREQYPALYSQIKREYSYSDPEDMRKEFLTQALRNQYAGVFEKGESKSILDQFLTWFSELWEKFKRKGLYIKDIPAKATLSDMVVLLKSGVSIKLGQISNKTFFNLKETDANLYTAVLNRANAEQKETIEKLLAASPVEFQEEGHTYIGKADGEVYASTTTIMKGKLDDNDLYKINRDIGSQLDLIAQAIIVGKDLNEILKLRIVNGVDILPNLSDEVMVRFYESFSKIVADWYAQGYVILPQLRIGDSNSKVAGSPDFVLINPNGTIESIIDLKTSKNNINSDKGGTLFESALVNPRTGKKEFLSTKEQHSLQVQTYRELLRLMGFDVKSLSTLHYRVGISDATQKAVYVALDDTAQNEGFSKHDAFVLKPASSNPTDGLYNLIDLILPNRAEEQDYMFEAPSGLSVEDIANSSAVVLALFKDRLHNLETQITEKLPQNHIGLEFLKDHYAQLSAVITNAEYLLDDNQPLAAYEALLDFHIDMLGRRTRIVKNHHINLANLNTEEKKAEYINKIAFIVRQSHPDTQAVAAMYGKMSLLTLTPELEAKLKTLNNIREDFANEAEDYLTNTFAIFWMKSTSKIEITDADITEMFQSSFDIEDASLYLRDLATSNSKILALLDRYYKFKMFEIEDSMQELRNKFEGLSNDLLVHHKGDESVAYHFMLKRDKDGVISGNYVNELDWEKYWTKWREAHKALENPNAIGDSEEDRWLQYIEDPQTQEDKDFNNKLYAAKQVRSEFMRAEEFVRVTDEKGWTSIEDVEDGEYHQYTEEFKAIRGRFERLTPNGWARKANVTSEQYAQYKKKYYTEEIEITSIGRDKNGELTGIPTKRKMSFVKNEFVKKRLTSSTGEDMRDPQWVKIMNQKDAAQGTKEKAEYEFYVNYIQEYETGILSKLPEDIRKKMIGKIGVIKASAFSDANSKLKGNFFGKFLQNVRNYFTWDAEESSVFVDEDGNMDKKRLPIYFVGDTKNIKIIENLRKKIEELNASFTAGTITAEAHTTESKKLKELLRIESNKVEKEQLETDLNKNLLAFANMAEYFFKMSEMENVLSQVDDMILATSFKKRNSIQGSLRQKGNNKEDAKILSEESNTYKRYQIWKDMVFYRNVNVYKSKGAQVVKKVMQALSLRSVGLNVFGQINNFTIGEITNAVERNRFFGGKYINTFYKREAFNRASVEYAKHVSSFRMNKDKGYYGNVRAGSSKYEAVIHFFNAIRQNQTSLNVNSKGIVEQTGSLGYLMMEKVEFAIQSKTAMSIIMSTEVKDRNTGEMVNLFDALVFDEKTGLASLPDHIEFSTKDRYGLQNLIWEVNKSVHGNYAFEDRMTIQNTLLGEIGAQFKKFIVPAIDARFRNGYMHEERGWVEGRYLAYRDFAKYLWAEKNFLRGWNKLTDIQKMNMFKNLTEFCFLLTAILVQVLFAALKNSLPPEDKKSELGKLLNFLSYQGSRVVNDILMFVPILGTQNQYNMIKNPFPIMTYLKDYADILGAAFKTITGEGVYSTGIRKGDYKLVKEIKDVIPLINLTNKWENFATIKDFYIK